MMDISTPYYEDKTRISNSSIGWFLNKGPAYFHKMLTEDVEQESTQALERGTMIHEYLLQPEEFQKDYVVWDKSRPSSAQQEKFCQALASSLEIEPNRAILDAYKQAYSTAGKSDDKMLLEGLKIASTLKDYIDFLKTNDSRKMISIWDARMLMDIKENIQKHKLANVLLEPIKSDNKDTHHEFHINWEREVGPEGEEPVTYLKCKSLLDSVTFDYKNKVCTIMDLKTTQKLYNFEESIKQYDYLRQLAFYNMAASWYLKHEKGEDIEKWNVHFYIIGIDTTGTYNIRVFRIWESDLISSYEKIDKALFEIDWHAQNNLWEYNRSYYTGDGAESLNL